MFKRKKLHHVYVFVQTKHFLSKTKNVSSLLISFSEIYPHIKNLTICFKCAYCCFTDSSLETF